jgi:hypothetical protein
MTALIITICIIVYIASIFACRWVLIKWMERSGFSTELNGEEAFLCFVPALNTFVAIAFSLSGRELPKSSKRWRWFLNVKLIIIAIIITSACDGVGGDYYIEQEAEHVSTTIMRTKTTKPHISFGGDSMWFSSISYPVHVDTFGLMLTTKVYKKNDMFDREVFNKADWITEENFKQIKCDRYADAVKFITNQKARDKAKREAEARKRELEKTINNYKCE